MVEPSRKRGPFDPRWPCPRRRGHLHLVPEHAEALIDAVSGPTDAPDERPGITHLPTFIPTEEEPDAPEEWDETPPEEDLTWQVAVAAILPLPTL